MNQIRHDDPRSNDQKTGDRQDQGPRDSEHRDGARSDEALDRALEKQSEAEKIEREHPGQPSAPPVPPR